MCLRKSGICFRNKGTVQEEILAREIFGEIARLKHLANFTLTNDIWMYLIVGVSYRIYFVGVLNIGEKLNKSPIAKIKSSPINLPVRYVRERGGMCEKKGYVFEK